jgi:hypothetical protein
VTPCFGTLLRAGRLRVHTLPGSIARCNPLPRRAAQFRRRSLPRGPRAPFNPPPDMTHERPLGGRRRPCVRPAVPPPRHPNVLFAPPRSAGAGFRGVARRAAPAPAQEPRRSPQQSAVGVFERPQALPSHCCPRPCLASCSAPARQHKCPSRCPTSRPSGAQLAWPCTQPNLKTRGRSPHLHTYLERPFAAQGPIHSHVTTDTPARGDAASGPMMTGARRAAPSRFPVRQRTGNRSARVHAVPRTLS